MKISYTSFSETGKRRDNQDYIQVLVDEENNRYAFILCDGMGGHSMGGMAAKIVATSIARDLRDSFPKTVDDFRDISSKASWVLDVMSEIYGGVQMGTTLVMAYIDGGKLTVMHCGDSRCYVYGHEGNLRYKTEDHIDGEYIGAPLARCYFSGRPEKALPDVMTLILAEGDRILLCSDGVYPCMSPDILRDRMMDERPLEDIMDTFAYMCEKFSQDNYSAIFLKVGEMSCL